MKSKGIITFSKYTSFAVALFGIALASSALAVADDNESDDHESRIMRGFEIAPVPLNLEGKNRELVGLGSYLVNAVGGCNDCHTNPSYAEGGDPYLGQPKQVNVAGYMAGGREFIPSIVSRNLTPDYTGLPLGGASYEEFVNIMRTGVDPDAAHPKYGPLLQVMPWSVYQDMTDDDLRAIYEYLSAIPCVEGEPGLPNPRTTRCSQ